MTAAEAITQPLIRRTQLTIEDLKTLTFPMQIQGNLIIIEYSLRNQKLKKPVILNVEKVLNAKEKGLVNYILSAFICDRPNLINFVFDNQSLIKLARHFLRHCSGSYHTCYTYVANIQKFCAWLGYNPDLIIQDLKPIGNIPDPERVQNHTGYLNDFLAELQDQGLTPGAVVNIIKSVKTFYRVNGIKIELTEPLSRRVTYKDRAPRPEELEKVLNIAALREKTIVSMLALGGFRESTLSMLQYRHVKEDIEKSINPIHIHVEAAITKGKYGDYDTFLGAEASTYLRLYIEQRIKGTRYTKPEILTDNSPLIKDENKAEPKPISSKQIRYVVHQLYLKANLVKKNNGHYDLRVHSLRKYFKTQLLALGVQPDYVDYMMGHILDTYHDIQSIGIDKLRNIYSASGLSIRKETHVSKLDSLKEMIRAMGMNPDKVLAKDALADGAITHKDNEDRQLAVLRKQLRELILNETSV